MIFSLSDFCEVIDGFPHGDDGFLCAGVTIFTLFGGYDYTCGAIAICGATRGATELSTVSAYVLFRAILFLSLTRSAIKVIIG